MVFTFCSEVLLVGQSAPVIGNGGALYGTTQGYEQDYGTVYALAPPPAGSSGPGDWIQTVLYSFANGNDGAYPTTGLAIGGNGVLYGTTPDGGGGDGGTVFSVNPPESPGGSWTEAVVHSFAGSPDGVEPGPVTIGSDGVLYGITGFGGTGRCSSYNELGCGIIFSLAPPATAGGTWTETILHDFNGVSDRYWNGVTIGRHGVLYGTTNDGGANGAGSIVSLTPPASPGGAWTERLLYSFSCGDDGCNPAGILAAGADGILYGATVGGGASRSGTVFSFAP
ncbi:MAG: choice-of-anchor tandem repeat GloVer-containing protein [Bryobacteraceae bacterium]